MEPPAGGRGDENGRETVRSFITLSSPLAPRAPREDDGTIIGGVPRSRDTGDTPGARIAGGEEDRGTAAVVRCPSLSRVQQEREVRAEVPFVSPRGLYELSRRGRGKGGGGGGESRRTLASSLMRFCGGRGRGEGKEGANDFL